MSLLSSIAAMIGSSRMSVDEEIIAKGSPFLSTVQEKPQLLTTAQILKAYGVPGHPDSLVTLQVPYPFRIAWDPKVTTNRITCHRKIAARLQYVFTDLLEHYGPAQLKALGIDLFGGLYNFRPQRGRERKYAAALKAKNFALAYTYLSRHSWAIAIDLDPARNGLKTKWKNAQFAKPEYKFMVDTFHKHGFIGYGPDRNYDAMHWEIGLIL